jgi:uncharacterized protein (DUF2235 family)
MNETTSLAEDDKPYRMPPFSGRNILIFSDGTGQAGGLQLDEYRSNVYKLFCATRCGPDTNIDPNRQLAFYDPGLGSKLAGEDIKVGFLRRIYNLLSSATGLGITKNIIDCYEALIRYWRPGDRIFLFGFSRGAYTVRCLGGVLSLCGVPEQMPGGKPLLRDRDSIRKIAREAVMRVYRHGAGTDDKGQAGKTRKERLDKQRQALGAQFREKYHSDGSVGPNVVPHFIGVWDTVAAVGVSPPAAAFAKIALFVTLLAASATIAWFLHGALDLILLMWLGSAFTAMVAAIYFIYIALRVKFVTGLPGYSWYETVHLTSFKMAFFDRSLNPHVRYARHAIAIDEHRADFDRVPWVNEGKPPNREIDEGPWFRQWWFAGNHSDIGGSYPENESRLSDIALGWMAMEARKAGLLIDENYLRLFGNYAGDQHDECRIGITFMGMKFRWREHDRRMTKDATLHPSVNKRFEGQAVLIYDEEKPYRPTLLAKHEAFAAIYLAEAQALEGEAHVAQGDDVTSTV